MSVVRPYYTEAGNPASWLPESFAEMLAAWSKVSQEPDEMVRVTAILGTIAKVKPGLPEGRYSPEVVGAARQLVGIFDYLASYRRR